MELSQTMIRLKPFTAAWPIPETQTDVTAFRGLATYFKHFIKGYAKIAQSLTEVTKDVKLCTPTFHKIKQLLTEAPLLMGF